MPRIELAYWHGTHKPGDVIDVDDVQLRELQRDGRVARVGVPEPTDAAPEPTPAAEPEAPEPGRKRR
ncbi:hypothetical protein [Streptomyces sp. NPDC056242]|uniref:hypothetical protein n=1 Tax=Streptomyces sp. NPDC056242 TaxID=3345760 RepID=UPI0035D85112